MMRSIALVALGAAAASPPLLPPLPAAPPGLQVPSLSLERPLIMHDPDGFLRDPSSPIQDPDGVWHAWVVFVPPKYGAEGWSGFIKHFHTKDLRSNWTNGGLALNHSSDRLAFDATGMCSPGAQYDPAQKLWYLFYTGATPEGTTGYPPRSGGSPMDNLSAQGCAVSSSPYGPWRRLGVVAPGGLAWNASGKGGGYRENHWNGLRVDSGRALIVNGTRLYSTKGIGNGTKLPDSNPSGTYQALQGVFFPDDAASWAPPYHAYRGNPVTRAGPAGNTYTAGGAENCEFYSGPDGFFHANCAAHGELYPHGGAPHYLVRVLPADRSADARSSADPRIEWQFVGFVPSLGAAEPTPVYEDGPPGDNATVRFFIARADRGVSLYAVHWSPAAAAVTTPAPWGSIIQSSNTTRDRQLAELGPIKWGAGEDEAELGLTVELDITSRRQKIFGFGGAFTEAAGYTFAQLSAEGKEKVLSLYFDPDDGIGYTTGRVAMNSPDFALGHYSYANTTGDLALADFQHGLPRDNEYVLPLLRAALNRSKVPASIRLFSAPWSPPAWMKVPFNPGGKGAMDVCRPDSLLPELRDVWAKYFSLWHSAMAQQLSGKTFWGFSAQNEPLAHGHMWDCCGYTLSNYTKFVTDHLMPVMKQDHPKLNYLAFDHNPDAIELWVNATYADAATKDWAWGSAVHWYSAEVERGVALNHTHHNHPTKPILHTEATVCRTILFMNETGWWNVGEQYGVGLMQYLQNWAVGFTDWNLMLDSAGGPSHDRGFGCNAPLMSDTASPAGVAVQAPYYFLKHFARFLPPGATVVGAMTYNGTEPPAPRGSFYYEKGAERPHGGGLAVLGGLQENGTRVLIVVNGGDAAVHYTLKDASMAGAGGTLAPMVIPAHAIQTLRWNAPVGE